MTPFRSVARLLMAAVLLCHQPAYTQNQPSWATRTQVLRSLVRISADGCPGAARSGSGFALEASGTIITAHHVVGGCSDIRVHYEGAPVGSAPKPARVTRVLPKGDLAMLTVTNAPTVPVLRLAPPPPDPDNTFAGAGYQNGQLSGGDLLVKFSTGSARLDAILTPQLLIELIQLASPIDTSQTVLRFNMALQPGMSGGPIVDVNGAVIGVVAGGLKAGAAPASWGWPATLIGRLKQSPTAIELPIQTGQAYYSSEELAPVDAGLNEVRHIRCGTLEMAFRGRKSFQNLLPGTDDYLRVQHIMNISTMSPAELGALNFELWVHEPSGATAVVPAGYPLQANNGVCRAATPNNEFRQVLWGAEAVNPDQVQLMSSQFETVVVAPLLPSFGFQFDAQLTTLSPTTGQPGPNFRDNGLVFNRKGIISPKIPFQGPGTPILHSFETLIARSGAFLGVVTINSEVTRDLQRCLQLGMLHPSCRATREHVRVWTHFVLATQLSTFPAN